MIGWLFTNLLAVVGVGYGWVNPFVGLMVYYIFALLRPVDLWFWSWSGNVPRYSLMIALATLVGFFVSGRGVWRGIGQAGPALFALYLYLAAASSPRTSPPSARPGACNGYTRSSPSC